MTIETLRAEIERRYAMPAADLPADTQQVVAELRTRLSRGEVRAAAPEDDGWRVHAWVKQGILLGFRAGELRDYAHDGLISFIDKDTFPPRRFGVDAGVRIVPGGSSVRDGAYVGRGVVCMPPMYINVGAYVGEGTMIDSHALVGSCAQVGRHVHVSAAAQLGGVLEPVGARPVIVEDDVLVGGNCGIYEGTRVGARAVLAPGTILTRGTPLYDTVHERVLRASPDSPLEVPPGAVVVPGSRPAASPFGAKEGLHLYAANIVKYRDADTDAAVALEEALR